MGTAKLSWRVTCVRRPCPAAQAYQQALCQRNSPQQTEDFRHKTADRAPEIALQVQDPKTACTRSATLSIAPQHSPSTLPAPKPRPPRLNQRRSRTRSDVRVALGGRTVAVAEQRPDDLLAGAHDGVAAASGVAGAVVGDAVDSRIVDRRSSKPDSRPAFRRRPQKGVRRRSGQRRSLSRAQSAAFHPSSPGR